MAPRSKRQKRSPAKNSTEDDSTKAATPPRSPPREPSLASFFILPHELKSHIIKLACRWPAPAATPVPSRKTQPLLDLATSFSLLVGSRLLYALVVPVLYHSVSLPRPSALAFFCEAIALRPQLGQLVRNLHVGPVDELSEDFWPLHQRAGFYRSDDSIDSSSYCPPCMQIMTSLKGREEPRLLLQNGGRWGVATERFSLRSASSFPGHQEVPDAMLVAQKTIDVDLGEDPFAYHGSPMVASVDYKARVYEAQAVLDLTLQQMERRQTLEGSKLSPSREGEDAAYPPLRIDGYPASPSKITQAQTSRESSNEEEEPWVLARSDVLQHLARPGSMTDRFDSPLLFARSGIDIVNTETPGHRRRPKLEEATKEEWADLFSPSCKIFSGSSLRSSSAIDGSHPPTVTIGALLTQLRMVLSSTPNLDTLSLTGFLERAVCGPRSVASLLPKLRAVSIGPPPERWFAPMLFDKFKFGQVEELRLCGVELLLEEAESIVANLPSLKRLLWSMPDARPYTNDLPKIVNCLAGRNDPPNQPTRPASSQEPKQGALSSSSTDVRDVEEVAESPDDNSLATRNLPLVEIRLHEDDVRALLDRPPSVPIKTAWCTGAPVRGQARRLLLKDSVIPEWGTWWEATSRTCGLLYEEGREWWEHGGMAGLREDEETNEK